PSQGSDLGFKSRREHYSFSLKPPPFYYYISMKNQQISGQKQGKINLYDYDKIINRTFALMQKDLSENNFRLIKKFDRVLVNELFKIMFINIGIGTSNKRSIGFPS
ncbi:MAG: hypothetical protein ACE5RI_09805, partial [Candidatus Nitrosomaritimum yanchengensis]